MTYEWMQGEETQSIKRTGDQTTKEISRVGQSKDWIG